MTDDARPRPEDLQRQVDLLLRRQVELRTEVASATAELKAARGRITELQAALDAATADREAAAGPALTLAEVGGQLRAALTAVQDAPLPEGASVGYLVRSATVELRTLVQVDDDGTPRLRFPDAGAAVDPALLTAVTLAFDATAVEPVDLAGLRDVPTLVGLPLEAARERLARAGLVLGEVEESGSTAPRGTVLGQDPETGGYVDPGSAVDVRVAVPIRLDVPDVGGRPLPDARAALAAAGLRTGEVRPARGDGEEGTVLSQEPAAGSTAEQDTAVDLTVVAPRPRVAVPPVRGADLRVAIEALDGAGLVVGRTEHRRGEEATGTVLRTVPEGGAEVPVGSPIDLVVAIRAVERAVITPQLVGLDLAAARRVLREGGWGSTVEAAPVPVEDGRFDLVTAQDPPAGHPVGVDAKVVRLTVPASAKPPSVVHGIGPAFEQRLVAAGFGTVGQIALADPEELAVAIGLSPARARRLHGEAVVANRVDDLRRLPGVDEPTAVLLAEAGVTSVRALARLDGERLVGMVKRTGRAAGTSARRLADLIPAAAALVEAAGTGPPRT